MKPTRCTLFLGTFNSTSVHVSGNLFVQHQQNLLYLCDNAICHSVWVAVWSAAANIYWKILVVELFQVN
jgi:hypothetical protein